jgi:soluble lytic murein transglycosylase-like protein
MEITRSANKGTRLVILIVFCVLIAHGAPGQDTPEIREIIDYYVAKHCEIHGVDPHLVHAIIQVESDYNPKAVSPKNAKGLMQLMPGTQKQFGVREPFSISENIRGGVAYLRYLDDLFKGQRAYTVAAYYSGAQYVMSRKGVVSREVFGYVEKVARNYRKRLKRAARVPRRIR